MATETLDQNIGCPEDEEKPSEEALAARRGSVLTPLPGPGSFKKKNPFFQKKKVFTSIGGGCPAGFGRGISSTAEEEEGGELSAEQTIAMRFASTRPVDISPLEFG